MVDSCQHCATCTQAPEWYCVTGSTRKYNQIVADKPGHTLDGRSQRIIISDKIVLRINYPDEQPTAVAPHLCASIATYLSLRH